MGYGGAEGFNSGPEDPPFVVTANNGFRAWYARDLDGPLSSLCFQHSWAPGMNTAQAAQWYGFSVEGDEYEPIRPTSTNSGGFYAYYAEDYFQPYNYNKFPRIDGMIEGFGYCVVGDKGFRSQHAIITAFCRPYHITDLYLLAGGLKRAEIEDRITRNLEERYPTVPIFDSPEEMLARVPLFGRPKY